MPEEPTPDELAYAWTLSKADQEQVLAGRGEGIRRRFAMQLCVLRRFGRFMEASDRIPLAYVNHLAQQLGLDPVLFADEPPSEPTENAQRERIRNHLGYRWFDADVEAQVQGWLVGHALEGIERELFRRVEELLRGWKVVLPAPEALERLVTEAAARGREAVFEQLAPRRCGLSSCLQPLPGYQPRSVMPVTGLLAALIAHGTNLGVATMGQSAEGISVDMLNTATDWYLREETIKAAHAIAVNFHHRLSLSSVWGDGTSSSSDGQRFAVRGRGLLGSFYPRYFGYYERAVTLYTHTSDQHAVYATQAISCGLREAPYLLDGLLDNNTILRLRQHTSDTHGYTEHIFGLCYLLGYDFMPRIKDLKDQRIYRMKREDSYGCLDPLFHGTIDLDIILEQWDNLVRLAASLRDRTSPAHVVVQRLAAGSINDRLSRALTQLGRIAKTIHILRYIHEEERRNWVQLLLNRGEFRHILAKHLFFAHHGIFRNADYEEIMNKASCLSLLCNAVLLWNTVKMGEHVANMRAAGHEVRDQDLARVSPLAHAHVIPNGTYFFDRPMAGEYIACNTLF